MYDRGYGLVNLREHWTRIGNVSPAVYGRVITRVAAGEIAATTGIFYEAWVGTTHAGYWVEVDVWTTRGIIERGVIMNVMLMGWDDARRLR